MSLCLSTPHSPIVNAGFLLKIRNCKTKKTKKFKKKKKRNWETFWEIFFLVSCQELDKKINSTLMSGQVWSWS